MGPASPDRAAAWWKDIRASVARATNQLLAGLDRSAAVETAISFPETQRGRTKVGSVHGGKLEAPRSGALRTAYHAGGAHCLQRCKGYRGQELRGLQGF